MEISKGIIDDDDGDDDDDDDVVDVFLLCRNPSR